MTQYEVHTIVLDDPLADLALTPEDERKMREWWEKALDRSMREVLEGKLKDTP